MSSVASSARALRGSGGSRSPSSLRRRALDAPWLYRFGLLAVVGALWEFGSITADSLFIPTFTGTMAAVVGLAANPEVWGAFVISNEALLYGFVASVVVGIPLGFGAARLRGVEGFIDPYLSILLVVPMAAMIPILLMSMGIGLAPRVVLVFLFSFPVLVVNARAGVRQVDPSLIEMATSFGATERTIWRRILLPGSLPPIMAGIRLALGRAVTAMVIVELLMVSVGIGGLILTFRGFFRAEELYGVVVLVVLEALVLISLARLVERRVAPWARQSRLRE